MYDASRQALTEVIEQAKRWLFRRQYVYQTTFRGPLADEVLRDLARFCRANQSTFHTDDRAHALAEGRREVWLRIANHLNLPPDRLWAIYDGRES